MIAGTVAALAWDKLAPGGPPGAAPRAASTPPTAAYLRADDVRGPATVRARESRLRRTVARYRGCLPRLAHAERRVLTLRAGVGHAPRSRQTTAHVLGTSVRRVTRLERDGLRRLRDLGGRGMCGGPADGAGTTSAAMVLGPRTPVTGTPAGAGLGAGATGSDPAGQSGKGGGDNSPKVLSEHQSSPLPDLPPPTSYLPSARAGGGGGTGVDLTLPLAGIALGIVAAFVLREMRRRDHTA